MHNIEKSGFKRGVYVGWNATGDMFEIRREDGGGWRATQQTGLGKNYLRLPASWSKRTLRELSDDLAKHYLG